MTESDNEAPQTRGFRVRGRVQGVGFRWWTRGVAIDLGLVGSVRNMSDGSVEVRASGRAPALEELELMLGKGPRFSRVDAVERFDVDGFEGSRDFNIIG